MLEMKLNEKEATQMTHQINIFRLGGRCAAGGSN